MSTGKNAQFIYKPQNIYNQGYATGFSTHEAIQLLKQDHSVVWYGAEGSGKSVATQYVLMNFIRLMGTPGGVNNITCRIATSFIDIRFKTNRVLWPQMMAHDEEEKKDRIVVTYEDSSDVEELSRFLKARHDEYEAALTSEASVNFPINKVLAGKIMSIVDLMDNEPEPAYDNGPVFITSKGVSKGYQRSGGKAFEFGR